MWCSDNNKNVILKEYKINKIFFWWRHSFGSSVSVDSANKYDTVELFVKRLATVYSMYK